MAICLDLEIQMQQNLSNIIQAINQAIDTVEGLNRPGLWLREKEMQLAVKSEEKVYQRALKKAGIDKDVIEEWKKGTFNLDQFNLSDEVKLQLNDQDLLDQIKLFQNSVIDLDPTKVDIVEQVQGRCKQLQIDLNRKLEALNTDGDPEVKESIEVARTTIKSALDNLETHVKYLKEANRLNRGSLALLAIGTATLVIGIATIPIALLAPPLIMLPTMFIPAGLFSLVEARDQRSHTTFLLKKAFNKVDGEYSSSWNTMKQKCIQALNFYKTTVSQRNIMIVPHRPQ
jgi:hypothetical protein